ncbi:MAG: efflux RND transporter periplasmic adaptor subunit [Paracoccus sp. (in: a-proteobacteria)]
MKTVLTIALSALMLAGPAGAEESAAATVPQQQPAAPSVTAAAARLAEVQQRVLVSGSLVPRQEVQVFAQVAGYEIVELRAEAGDRVEKGQLLARLSRDTLAAELAKAEAEYQRAEAGVGQAQSQIASSAAARSQTAAALERVQHLLNSGSATQAALDLAVVAEANARAQAASAEDGLAVARAALAQAGAARDLARLNLGRTDVVAPQAGLIVARQAEMGAIAAAGGEPLFRLAAGAEIELSAEVIETALHQLATGDPAEIEGAGIGAVSGRVRLLPASVDPVTRLGKLRIALDPDPGLRPGLFADGAVITLRRQAVTVAATAVLADDRGDWVQLIVDGAVSTRQVQAGLLWQSRREILSGVEPGDSVIARAGAFFRDGDRVTPVALDPASADPASTDPASTHPDARP